jgi:hypothetical protein
MLMTSAPSPPQILHSNLQLCLTKQKYHQKSMSVVAPRSLFGFVPGEQERAATKTLQDGTASATWNRLSRHSNLQLCLTKQKYHQKSMSVVAQTVQRHRWAADGGTSASSNKAEDLNAESEAGMVRLSSFWRLCLLMTK